MLANAFTLALLAPLTVPLSTVPRALFDTLVFDDGTTHILDETLVSEADDIIVRGSGFTYTTVVLTSTARVGEINVFTRGIANLRDQSSVAGSVSLNGSFAHFALEDSATIEGDLNLPLPFTTANLNGDGSVGAVTAGDDSEVTLGGHVTIEGDFTALGDVTLNGGSVLGSATIAGFRHHQDPPTEFLGDLTLQFAASARFTDKQFGGDVTVEDFTRIEIRGASQIAGVLRVKDQARVILAVSTADIPAGFLQDSSGVFLALDSNGDHVFYSYERDPGASILLVRADDPASTTVCAQSLPNSTGGAGHVEVLGSSEVASGELTLRVTELPTYAFSFFFVGTELSPGVTASGDICTGGNIGRLVGPGQIQHSGETGSVILTFDTTMIPGNPITAATPGATYYFQCWNRDVISGLPASRLSDTAAVTFE